MDTGNLKFNGQDITYTGQVLTYMGGDEPTPDPVAERDAKYATDTEAGAHRFRRLVSLGYV